MTGSGNTAVERSVQIVNRLGMHARPAAEFVKLTARYSAQIHVEKEGLEVDGKSIMGVLMLAAGKGMWVKVECRGAQAQECLTELRKLIADKFGESQ